MLHIIENNKKERAILIGLVTQNQTLEQLNEYFDELVFLDIFASEQKRKITTSRHENLCW